MARAVVFCAALFLPGCGRSTPQFSLNLEGRDPEDVSRRRSEAVAEVMTDLFGTPDEAVLPEGVDLNSELLKMAAGPGRWQEDENGRPLNRRGLYRRHCAACHGISGDGVGPLSLIFNPYPSDFRGGVFKYTSTLTTPDTLKPVKEDLKRTLLSGIPGTGMPSFVKLEPIQIEALTEYVKYLSIRGETEFFAVQLVVDDEEYLPLGVDVIDEIREDGALWAARSWDLPQRQRNQYVVVPPPMPKTDTPELLAASIARGRELYNTKDAQCVKCHGPDGAGDGEETELYDDLNKRKKGVSPEQTKQLSRRFRLPLQRLRARDFREGAFRGGNRPQDLYWRIHLGIKGTSMPPAGPAPTSAGVFKPEEIWHLVNYIRSLGGIIDE